MMQGLTHLQSHEEWPSFPLRKSRRKRKPHGISTHSNTETRANIVFSDSFRCDISAESVIHARPLLPPRNVRQTRHPNLTVEEGGSVRREQAYYQLLEKGGGPLGQPAEAGEAGKG